jgi:hypothetical protein
VRVAGRQVKLANKEFALLHHLAAEPARVFTKHELLRDVWGFRSQGTTRHYCVSPPQGRDALTRDRREAGQPCPAGRRRGANLADGTANLWPDSDGGTETKVTRGIPDHRRQAA